MQVRLVDVDNNTGVGEFRGFQLIDDVIFQAL